jgi:hypothetical protein
MNCLSDNSDRINPWEPYKDQIAFETAWLFYKENQLSATQIDKALCLWQASLSEHRGEAPFKDHQDLYSTIDATRVGGIKWESFTLFYNQERPSDSSSQLSWMDDEYVVWFRDPQALIKEIISNPGFAAKFDYAPYHEYVDGEHQYQNLMSGNWAWRQAVCYFKIFIYFIINYYLF